MSQIEFWKDLERDFDVDLGDTILASDVTENRIDENIVSICWKIVSVVGGQHRVEFRRQSDNKLHMPGAPAVVYENGDKLYYQNGFLHNMNGPAKIINVSGRQYCEYYQYGMLTGTNGGAVGINPKQLPTIPHLPGEPVANKNDNCWK